MTDTAGTLKAQLQSSITAAMKARDELTLSALRQAMAALSVAETSGTAAVTLSDDQVRTVLATEARKHHETADAFDTAGRPEQAARERAEAAVLEAYLPATLTDEELSALISVEVAAAAADGVVGMKAMGRIVSAVRAKAGVGTDGGHIAAMVKASLA
jgi:uncharacterized protein